jgi:hypothetical protein
MTRHFAIAFTGSCWMPSQFIASQIDPIDTNLA